MLFVSLGLGSVIASAVEVAPWLSIISVNKGVVFLAVGLLLVFNYWFAVVRPRQMNCAPGDVCHIDSPTMRVNRKLFWISAATYVVAVSVTYAALWWVRSQS